MSQTTAPKTASVASSGRRLLFKLSALGLGAVVALLIVEIALRLWGWAAPGYYQGGQGPLPIRSLSAEGGFGRDFSGSGRHTSFDFDVPVHINLQGFRERDLEPKADGEWRIGLFGDSMTAGHGLLRRERFGDIWINAVQDKRPGTTLWNFGSPGAGTWQNADFLATGAEQFELDEIILALFAGNEIKDNAIWSKLRELSSAELRDRDTTPRYSRLRTWMRNNSRLATFIWFNILSLAQANRAWYSDSRESLATNWQHTERALDSFKEAVGGRPFTIWYLPSHAEWDDGVWQSIRKKHVLADDDRAAVREHMLEWARANDVPLVDATPWFEGQTVEELKLPVDPHWNAKGHKLVGEGLASNSDSSYHLRRSP